MQTQPTKNEAKPERTKTIVINNREALVLAQLPHKERDAKGRIIPGECIKFIPGANLVDTETLKTLRKSELFDSHFKTKIARSPAPEQNPEKVGQFILVAVAEVPAKRPLSKIEDGAEIAEIVKETFSVDLLRQWLADEGRSDVRATIENQIRTIAVTGVPAGA